MDSIIKFPTLDISEFRHSQSSGDNLLYNELKGNRHIEKPHKHDFFLFMLFEEGGGIHTIDFVDYPVAGSQLHILFPEQIHKWELPENTHAHQIMIGRSMFETLAGSLRFSQISYQNHPIINLNPNAFKELLYEFRLVKAELAKPAILWEIINERVKLIALMASREAETLFSDQTIYKTKPILFKYLSLIDTFYKTEKLLAFYANQLNISANYLNILCKRHLNASATALIHQRLILETKRMLSTSDSPLKIIAAELGFYDMAHFSKFFKSNTRMTPRSFREQS
ncbi:AraC family transcriptional regulator [Mucilaginibacter agri]|uniref:Helix-turn-helix domain-containing protein n=1 Tax=Mucilaginibacter agri TaxID=2695265 RepID=A0A965ZCU8_9SPHI|nr:helix-turn-helix transcriptional regulator [Mucilaginibacter agri]NCD68659.1 helix-turn-helix domain-containing protein [Mucilaginibacter agri]